MKNTGPLAALALGTACLCASGDSLAADRIRDNFTFTYSIEVAGADASDVATDKELRESGTKMVPAQPSATSRDPLKQDAPKTVEKPAPQPVPAAETGNEPAATEDKATAPAAAAQETAPAPDAPAATDPGKDTGKMAETGKGEPLFRPYLRIDGGYAMTSDPDGTGANGPHSSSEVQDTGLLGIGIGTRVEDQVRVEGMLTYRSPMSVDSTDGAGNTLSGEVESISAMVNLYYDVTQAHEWLGGDTFTPYIGAGVGISMLDTDTMQSTAGTSERGTQAYNLTYAAMAGMSSKISDFVTADVGYRFINLGQFEQDGSFSGGGSTTATKYDDLFAHEFRAGLRFQF